MFIVATPARTTALARTPLVRGPERSGISKEKGLLQKWPEKGPKLLWTYRDAGLGFSSFAIIKDTLYTIGTGSLFSSSRSARSP